MDRLDRRDVTDTAFDIVLRGYDKRQVEERLRLLGAELAAAQDALRTATQRITMLEDALNQARSGPVASQPVTCTSARGSKRSSNWLRTRPARCGRKPKRRR